jgi:hypothetical protein
MYFLDVREGFQEPPPKPKGIIIELIGGLGNQLYIYSAAKLIQKASSAPIYLKLDAGTAFTHTNTDYRPILFNDFEAIDTNSPIFQDKVDARLQIKFWDPWTPDTLPKTDKAIYLTQQWYQHLPSIQTVVPEVSERILGILSSTYQDTGIESGSAFMHVRRGDYTNPENNTYLLDINYYLQALKHLNSNESINAICIFSDEMEWCKKQAWDSPKQIRYIDEPDEMKALYMMSQCNQGAIISNSTFSTWGALLGSSPKGSTVVYPSKWLYGAEMVFPPSWIRI